MGQKYKTICVPSLGKLNYKFINQWINFDNICLSIRYYGCYTFEKFDIDLLKTLGFIDALILVSEDGRFLKFINEEFRNNKDIVRYAIESRGVAFAFASNELRANKEICIRAVSKFGFNIHYVNKCLQYDRDIVLASIKQDYTIAHQNLMLGYKYDDDVMFKFWSLRPSERKTYARKRLIKGIMEDARIRRKYHPEGPFMKAMFEKDLEELNDEIVNL